MARDSAGQQPATASRRAWYDSNEVLVGLLVLLGPLGALLLWLRRPGWDPFVKGVLSVYAGIWTYVLLTLLGVVGASSPPVLTASVYGTPGATTAYRTPTAAAAVTTAPVAAAPTVEAAPTATPQPPTVAPSPTVPAATATLAPSPSPTLPPSTPTPAPSLTSPATAYAPSPTPDGYGATPTPTGYAASPTPTGYAESTPTPDAYATPGAALEIVLDETFADNSHQWPDEADGPTQMIDGGYRLLSSEPGKHVAVRVPLGRVLSDAVVTARFTRLGGGPGSVYGLILRDQDTGRYGDNQNGQYYLFAVNDRGQASIRRRDGDFWSELAPWTAISGLHPDGQTNELSARALGTTLSLLVNGKQVVAVEDVAFYSGFTGLFVAGEKNEVLVNRLTVAAPKAG